ncbi:MAG: type I glutamate--ammonia ligase [Micavibrio sp.]|nr:type I glutamate--ammonia ligase [Micavibrio sp.]|tara:strand:+ start:1824 stop:3257 length:1434 start_codon:yes stop_codon:yes gene_type:complete
MASTNTSFKSAKDFLKYTQDAGLEYVTFNFTDLKGKLQHISYHISNVDEDLLTDGFFFDGSSIIAWKSIHESDMNLRPDLTKTYLDPYSAQPTHCIFCDVFDPITGEPYERDPRSIAKAAEQYLKDTGIADEVLYGPEPEFFVFNDVRFKDDMFESSYTLESQENPTNSGKTYEQGNMGHRPTVKGGYFPVPPIDSLTDLRAQMLTDMDSIGLDVEKHHHEVAASQCELGIKAATLVPCADNVQLYKYVVHNTAHGFGMTATFMPKPVYGDNGSGMHVHQSLRKNKKPLFAGDKYAGLSDECLFYIGGLIKHAKALNAFTNPTTNSYKRLVPGYEAPVIMAYSARNRSVACRIPMSTSPNGKRVEARFPDPACNPYLAFAAMMMAGLDGIENKIHPGEAQDRDFFEDPKLAESEGIPTVARSLREALESLNSDRAFLTKGNVFSDDMIDAYINMHMADVEEWEMHPTPGEFKKYYSV